jgi:hypothetical protein
MNKDIGADTALEELSKLKKRYDDTWKKIETYQRYEEILEVPHVEIPQAETFDQRYTKRLTLWTNRQTFASQRNTWYTEDLRKQDSEAIVAIVKKYHQENLQMKIKARDEVDEVLDAFTDEVKEVHAHKELIQALGRPAMQPRHWKKVFALLEGNFTGGLDLPIQFN